MEIFSQIKKVALLFNAILDFFFYVNFGMKYDSFCEIHHLACLHNLSNQPIMFNFHLCAVDV